MKLVLQLLEGSLTSLEIFFLTLIFSLPLGLIVAKGRMSKCKVLSVVVDIYIQIMRGTPLILQLIFFYFVPFYIFGSSMPRFVAVIVAFVLNYAAYFGEIYRGGFQSIDKGQYEGAKVLGLNKIDTLFFVILPQVLRNTIPSIGNEVITLVKDTALASTLGVIELFRVAQTASSRAFSTIPIFVAGIFYFVMNYVVSKAFVLIEKKISY